MKPWVLPVAAVVLGVAWILWLARNSGLTEDTVPQQVPFSPTTASPTTASPTTARHETAPTAKEAVSAPAKETPAAAPKEATAAPRPAASSPGAPAPSSARAAPAAGTEPALQLSIQAPVSANVGEAFDLRVTLATRQRIGRIVAEISYDPVLLKARRPEEIDYSQRAPGERAFRIEQGDEGHLDVVLGGEPGMVGKALPPSAAVAQFEPLAPGRAQIRVTRITVFDEANKSLAWTATGRESEVAIR